MSVRRQERLWRAFGEWPNVLRVHDQIVLSSTPGFMYTNYGHRKFHARVGHIPLVV